MSLLSSIAIAGIGEIFACTTLSGRFLVAIVLGGRVRHGTMEWNLTIELCSDCGMVTSSVLFSRGGHLISSKDRLSPRCDRRSLKTQCLKRSIGIHVPAGKLPLVPTWHLNGAFRCGPKSQSYTNFWKSFLSKE